MRYFTKSLYLISMAAFCLFTAKVQAQIVAFGASNVAGKGVWPAEAWPAQLEQMLKAKGYNVHVKNAGKSGDTTSGMLHRLNSAIPSGTKIVILDVSGGYHNNLDATAASRQKGPADMTEIEARLKARGITVIRESAGGVSLAYKQADKLHLSAQGHKLLAERLLPRVISALSGSTG